MGPGALGAPSAAKGGLGARLLGTSAPPVLLARRPLALNREKALAAADRRACCGFLQGSCRHKTGSGSMRCFHYRLE